MLGLFSLVLDHSWVIFEPLDEEIYLSLVHLKLFTTLIVDILSLAKHALLDVFADFAL